MAQLVIYMWLVIGKADSVDGEELLRSVPEPNSHNFSLYFIYFAALIY